MANIRHPVLTKRIMISGFGRPLTRAERARLAALGVAVPARSRVVPVHGSDYIGALYRPVAGGMSDLGISVTLSEKK
jgi:hypothetical protein